MMPTSWTLWLKNHLIPCPLKAAFSIDCPGCGLQRGIVALLDGNIAESWRVYPPAIFIVLTLVFTAFHLVFGFRYGAFFIKLLYITSTLAICINYGFKVIHLDLL